MKWYHAQSIMQNVRVTALFILCLAPGSCKRRSGGPLKILRYHRPECVLSVHFIFYDRLTYRTYQFQGGGDDIEQLFHRS